MFDWICHEKVLGRSRASEPLVLLLGCFIKKRIERLGDRGAGPAECDLARGVLLVSTVGAVSWDNSSPPSSCCHSMASGTLGLEAMVPTSYWESYRLFPTHTTGVSKF